MSYNESLNPNSNYPLMSQSQWDSSPMAEEEPPEKDFDICISQSLSKSTKVTTSDYTPYYDEETRYVYPETDNTDWRQVCDDSGVYTPLELIEEFKKFLQEHLENLPAKSMKKRHYLNLIKECEGWISDELEIVEE